METKNEIVKINPSDYGLDETKAQEITKGLKTILAEREILKEQYKECILLEITTDSIPRFKELRLSIRDNRTKGIEVWHKANKAFFLAGGNFVDAIRRKESAENEYMEEKLLEGEKFFENQERERTEKLRIERLALIKPYTEIEPLALGHMEQTVFDNLLQGFKVAYEVKIATEKKAEEDAVEEIRIKNLTEVRKTLLLDYWGYLTDQETNIKFGEIIAEDFELLRVRVKKQKSDYELKQAEIKKENDRLKKEKDDREVEEKKKVTAEKTKVDKHVTELVKIGYVKQSDRIYSLGGYTINTDILKSLNDTEFKTRIKEVNDNIIRDKQLKEIEDKKVADEKRKKAEEKKAKLAPDKVKLLNFMQTINNLPRPDVKSIEAADIASKANIMLIQTANYIKDNINKI